jgi:nitroreductase
MSAREDPAADDWAELALALIGSRYSVAPRKLVAPGPSPAQLQQLVEAAATAPDHHDLRPWRLVRIGDAQRDALAAVFEACARERQPPPTEADLAKSRSKAYRAPELLLAVLRLTPADDEVPDQERLITAGAALMNLLLAAHAMGYGAMLTSGRSIRTAALPRAFGLAAGERPLCFVSIGTPAEVKRRPRPSASELLSDWRPGDG